jgi:hypothetical protein
MTALRAQVDLRQQADLEPPALSGLVARVTASVRDVALALERPRGGAAASAGTYAEGYFDGLCFALAVATGESPRQIAARFACRHS